MAEATREGILKSMRGFLEDFGNTVPADDTEFEAQKLEAHGLDDIDLVELTMSIEDDCSLDIPDNAYPTEQEEIDAMTIGEFVTGILAKATIW